MNILRRKSSVTVSGGPASLDEQKRPFGAEDEDDDDIDDIFSAVVAASRGLPRPPRPIPIQPQHIVNPDDEKRDAAADVAGTSPPSPLPPPPPAGPLLAQPSFHKFDGDIPADALRGFSAVPWMGGGKDGEYEDEKEGKDSSHERKTSSLHLIAGILGASPETASLTSPSSSSPAPFAPPPLMSGRAMEVQETRRELPRVNMRDGAAAQPPPRPSPSPPQRPLPVEPHPPAHSTARSPPTAHRTASLPSPSSAANPFEEGFPRDPSPAPTRVPASSSNPFADPSPASLPSPANPFDDADHSPARLCVALHDFVARAADQLSCRKGEVLEVIDDGHPHWTKVCNADAVKGLVPVTYLGKRGQQRPPQPGRPSRDHRRTMSQPPLSAQQQRGTGRVRATAPPTSARYPPSMELPPPPYSPGVAPSAMAAASLPPQPVPQAPAMGPPRPRSPAAALPLPRLSRPASTPNAAPPLPPVIFRPPSLPPAPSSSPSQPPRPSLPSPAPRATPRHAHRSTPTSPASPSSSLQSALEVCEALYSYDALADDQLALSEGEKLLLVDRSSPHWWTVVNGRGATGLVPTTYIRLFTAEAPAVRPTTTSLSSPPPPPPAGAVGARPRPRSLSQPRPALPSPPPPRRPTTVDESPLLARPVPPERNAPPLAPPLAPQPPSRPSAPAPLSVVPPAPPLLVSAQSLARRPSVPSSPSAPSAPPSASPPARSPSAEDSPAPARPHHSLRLVGSISAPIPSPSLYPTASQLSPPPTVTRVHSMEEHSFPPPPFGPPARAGGSPVPSPPRSTVAPPLPVPVAALPPPASPRRTPSSAPASAAASAPVGRGAVAERGEAVHSFTAQDGVQLSVSRGDALMIVHRLDNGWTLCRLLHTGISGLVPTSHIRSGAAGGS